jgi:hypothetical protein
MGGVGPGVSERLVDDPDGVSALAGRVSDTTGIPVTQVEKDFWVTEVLRGVAATADELGVEVLFKGGTSLSKVFNLIQRFSEDVDMLVILGTGTKGGDDKVLKDLVLGAALSTRIEAAVDGATATKGVKRAARFHYPTPHGVGPGLSEGVFLELGARGGALGSLRTDVTSLIAEHAADAIDGFPEAAAVSVRVLAPWRTLVEKLVLLHTAHSASDSVAAVKGARHVYDVYRLLSSREVLAGVAEAGVAAISRDVCLYSRHADLDAVDRPEGGFASSPAFTGGPHVEATRAEYDRRVLGELLWPDADRPTFDECIAATHEHAADL